MREGYDARMSNLKEQKAAYIARRVKVQDKQRLTLGCCFCFCHSWWQTLHSVEDKEEWEGVSRTVLFFFLLHSERKTCDYILTTPQWIGSSAKMTYGTRVKPKLYTYMSTIDEPSSGPSMAILFIFYSSFCSFKRFLRTSFYIGYVYIYSFVSCEYTKLTRQKYNCNRLVIHYRIKYPGSEKGKYIVIVLYIYIIAVGMYYMLE